MEKVSDQNKNIPILVDKLDHLKYKTDILSTSHKSMKNEMENISTNLTAYRTVVKKNNDQQQNAPVKPTILPIVQSPET